MAAVHGLPLSAIGQMFRSPFPSLSDGWDPKTYVVLHIDRNDFEGDSVRSFKDLKNGCAAQIILQALASIVDRKDLGTSYTNTAGHTDPQYCFEGVPKTVQVLEEIISRSGDEFRGLRLWIFVMDGTYSFAKGWADLVSANAQRSSKADASNPAARGANSTSGAQGRSGRDSEGGYQPHLAHQTIRTVDDLASVFGSYTRTDFFEGDSDRLHRAENAIDGTDSVLNPYSVLTLANAIRLLPPDVSSDQGSIETYFRTDDGVGSAETFEGHFPKPARTYRVLTNFFSPDQLYNAPVPTAIREFFHTGHREVEEWTVQRDLARRDLQRAEQDGDDAEREEVEYRLVEANENLQRRVQEMEYMTLSALNEMGSDNRSLFLSTPEIEEKMSDRNIFMKLAKQNDAKLATIGTRHQPGSPRFESEMTSFRYEAVREFWDTFMTSDTITPAARSVRKWFKGLSTAQQWFENNQITRSLSPYGNMVVRMTAELDKVCAVETNFSLAWLAIGTKLCTYQFKWGLRPNLLLTGEGASGKSFIFDLLEMISVPGVTLNATHVTAMAFQSDEDMSDIMLIFHEMPPTMIGIDRYGNEIGADPYFKNRLTKQMTVTVHPVKDSDTRRVAISVNRCMGTTVAALNERVPSTSTAIMQRFLRHSMTKTTRVDADPDDSTYRPDWGTDDDLNADILHRFKLQDFYLFAAEKAIESHALPDVDVGVAKTVARWVFKELENEGVPRPQRRHIDMYFDLCRIFTIYYSIEAEFFSELGVDYREDAASAARLREEAARLRREPSSAARHPEEKITYKAFKPDYLCELPRWWVVTQEIAVHVMTVMEAIWIPTLKTRISKAIAYHMVSNLAHSESERWEPIMSDPGRAISGTEFKKDPVGTTGECTYDLEYVQVFGESYKAIASRVQALIHDKPSANDIMGGLLQMQFEYVNSRQRQCASRRVDAETGTDMENYFRHRDALTARSSAKATPQLESERESDKETKYECLLCAEEFSSENDLRTHLTEFMTGFLQEHFGGTEPKEVRVDHALVDDPNAQPRLIPCVILDECSLNPNKKRVCLSVAIINKDFGNVLRTCIPRALEHAKQGPERFITGFPYSRAKPVKDSYKLRTEKGKSSSAKSGAGTDLNARHNNERKQETFCNVFDVLELKRGARHRIITNNYSYSTAEVAALYNRLDARHKQECGLKPIQMRPGSVVDKPIDYIHMVAHWLKNGIPAKSGRLAYPPVTKHAMWRVRNTNPRFKDIRELVVDNYPHDWIAAFDESRDAIRKLRTDVDEMDATAQIDPRSIPESMPAYSDLFGGEKNAGEFDPFDWEADACDLDTMDIVTGAGAGAAADAGGLFGTGEDDGYSEEIPHPRTATRKRKRYPNEALKKLKKLKAMNNNNDVDDIIASRKEKTANWDKRRRMATLSLRRPPEAVETVQPGTDIDFV